LLLIELGIAIILISWLPLKLLTRFLNTRPSSPRGYDQGSLLGYRFGIALGLVLTLAGVVSGIWSSIH